MKRALLLLLIFCASVISFGQGRKSDIYRTQIITHHGQKVTGVLSSLGDSTVHIIPLNQVRRGEMASKTIPVTFAVKDIYALRIREKGAVGRGALLGGGAGLVLGALIGYVTYSPCASSGATGGWFDCIEILDQTDSTIMGGVTGTMAGAGMGALVGSGRQKILIFGDQETYRQLKINLEPYVLKIRE